MHPFDDMLSLAEAAQRWGKDDSTLRYAIRDGRLEEGRDVKKFGKQWIVTKSAMCRVFGAPPALEKGEG